MARMARQRSKRPPPPLHKILLALVLGTGGALVAHYLKTPLAWMLGAMGATTVAAMSGLPVALPISFRTAMMTVLGVMLGAGFAPEILHRFGDWSLSLIGLGVYTLVVTAIVAAFLRRVAGYGPTTAYFAASPGGLSLMSLVGAEAGGDERIIALTHTSRILLVVLTLPLVMPILFGYTPGPRPAAGIPLLDAHPLDMLVLAGCAVIGFGAAWLVRLPAAAVLGPMALSAALHMSGLTTAKPPMELVAAAQVVVGTTIGCRFAGVTLKLIGRTILASLGSTAILVAGGMLFAVLLHPLTGLSTIGLFLAYAPGGVAEMSLIALALQIDVALVATHHIVRIFFIVMFAPLLFRVLPPQLVGRRPQPAAGED